MYEPDDPYAVLQIAVTAESDAIRAAYRRLALLYHPDRNSSSEATEMMKRLNNANDALSDRVSRVAQERAKAGGLSFKVLATLVCLMFSLLLFRGSAITGTNLGIHDVQNTVSGQQFSLAPAPTSTMGPGPGATSTPAHLSDLRPRNAASDPSVMSTPFALGAGLAAGILIAVGLAAAIRFIVARAHTKVTVTEMLSAGAGVHGLPPPHKPPA